MAKWAANKETVTMIMDEIIPALDKLKDDIEADGIALKASFNAEVEGLGVHADTHYEQWVNQASAGVSNDVEKAIKGAEVSLLLLAKYIAEWLQKEGNGAGHGAKTKTLTPTAKPRTPHK